MNLLNCSQCGGRINPDSTVIVFKREGLIGYSYQEYKAELYPDFRDPRIIGVFGGQPCFNAFMFTYRAKRQETHWRN